MTKLYKHVDGAARAWAKPLGIRGKQGSTYLYIEDEGRLKKYLPHFSNGRAIQGWRQLGFMLEDRGVVKAHFDPETKLFLGYEVVGRS